MAKYLYLLFLANLFFLSTTCSLHAQERRFKAAAIVGANLSQLDGDRLAGFNSIGFNAGGRVNAVLSDRWELSLGILYSQQGSSRNTGDDPGSIYDRIRLNYVEVPVLIYFTDWKFQIGAGASYAQLINYEVTDALGVDITDLENYQDSLVSVVISGTFNFTEHIGLNVRWSRGLNNIRVDEDRDQLISRVIGVRGIYTF